MSSSSVSLEVLPNEILLMIIQQVDFSKANLAALTLISHRFHDLIISQGNRLLYDIAAVQFPLALITERDPPAFSIKSSNSLALRTLEEMAIRSENCENVLRIFQKIDRLTEQETRYFRKHFALPSWEENVLVGLHISYKLQSIAKKPYPYYAASLGSMIWDESSLYEAYVSSLPPALCLAIRHTMFICLDSIKATIWKVGDWPYRRPRFGAVNMDKEWRMDKQSKMFIEHNPVFAIARGCRSVDMPTFYRQNMEMPPISPHLQSIQDDIKQLQDSGAMKLFPSWTYDVDLVTRRIRKDILEDWNLFVKENPRVIAGLRSQDVRSKEDVRALIESFLVGFEE